MYGLCVLTVLASIRDMVSIGDRHLFATRH